MELSKAQTSPALKGSSLAQGDTLKWIFFSTLVSPGIWRTAGPLPPELVLLLRVQQPQPHTFGEQRFLWMPFPIIMNVPESLKLEKNL